MPKVETIDASPAESVAPVTVPVVGVPSDIPSIESLVPAGQQASGMTVLLALVGAVGCGAAFKVYQSVVKNKADAQAQQHELEMEKLRQNKDDSHQKCSAERAALEAKLFSVEQRLEAIEKKKEESLIDFDGFDPESIEKRLKKIEGKLRGPGRPKKEQS